MRYFDPMIKLKMGNTSGRFRIASVLLHPKPAFVHFTNFLSYEVFFIIYEADTIVPTAVVKMDRC
jgi:hypothetical protein